MINSPSYFAVVQKNCGNFQTPLNMVSVGSDCPHFPPLAGLHRVYVPWVNDFRRLCPPRSPVLSLPHYILWGFQ